MSDQWRVRHPGIGTLAYGSEAEARIAAGTAGEVLPPTVPDPAPDYVRGWNAALEAVYQELGPIADRLRATARETGDKTHFGTAAGVSLARLRVTEISDRKITDDRP
jgi:hypothetical protein